MTGDVGVTEDEADGEATGSLFPGTTRRTFMRAAAAAGVTSAGDGSNRLFTVDQPGQLRVHDEEDGLLDEPFLDVSDHLPELGIEDLGGFDERGLLDIDPPQFNHNADSLEFGPDGYLYVPMGDGGAAADNAPGHVSDWYDRNAGGNAQNVSAPSGIRSSYAVAE